MPQITDPKGMLLLGSANCQSYDGNTAATAWKKRAELMKLHKRNVWVVQESTEAGREIMLGVLGKSWKVWTLKSKSLGIMFDSDVWDYKTPLSVSFGTSFGHGALLVPMRNKLLGVSVDVEAIHMTPKSVATTARKLINLLKASKLARSNPTVMAGDFALNSPPLLGWKRLTPKSDTMDAKGDQTIDAVFGKKIVGYQGAAIINPGSLSDHKWVKVDVILKESTPTN